MTSGLRQLYPGVKARASNGWGRFVLSVLQMAVPTGGSVPTRPPHRPLAVCPADGCFSQAAVRQRRTEAAVPTGIRPCNRPVVHLAVRPCNRPVVHLAVRYGRPPSRPLGRSHGGRPPLSPGRPCGHLLGRPLRGRPPASSPHPAGPLLRPVDLLRQRYS